MTGKRHTCRTCEAGWREVNHPWRMKVNKRCGLAILYNADGSFPYEKVPVEPLNACPLQCVKRRRRREKAGEDLQGATEEAHVRVREAEGAVKRETSGDADQE